jgi:cobalt/nickel transport system ATP-binding protein
MNSQSALRLDAVTVRYENTPRDALDRCTFSIGERKKVALLGLNGSGKTTVLLAAAGLIPFSGKIEVFGIGVEQKSLSSIRERLGFLFSVPDDQILLPLVLDDVSYTLRQRGVPHAEALTRAREALDDLEASALADRHVHAISHGERLRVALAGVLAARPSLLLLDEPSTTLDPPGRRELAAVLSGIPSAVLVATNDFAFVKTFCSRFLVLEQGRIVEDGSSLHDLRFHQAHVL